jgi:integrase
VTTTQAAPARSKPRQRGSIRPHRSGFQVRVTAGVDSATGERIVLCETASTEREAEKVRTRLLAKADALTTARSKANFGYLLDAWFPKHEVGPSTKATYESLIRNHIRPALGAVPLTKLHRSAAKILEDFYGDLRRCNRRCDGRPMVDHRVSGPHDCTLRGCRPHTCTPLAASSVRQIHAVISGALSAAVRWDWLPFNPAETARIPAKPRPDPHPPTAADAARLVEEAWAQDEQWGLYLWLAMVLGARRGELVALRWQHVDLETGFISVSRNYVRAGGEGYDKDTKGHQMRRLNVDQATRDLLESRRKACADLLALGGAELRPDHLVFSASPDLLKPRDPSSMTRRYKRLATKLGIDSHLHELRHYSATELLTAGVDLRTVAGRLGHGDGTTTLRHYAAWVTKADKQAASIISARLPRPMDQSQAQLVAGQDMD